MHRDKKLSTSPQNMVIYKCNFCSHQNQKRGTMKGHMKEICPPTVKSSEKPKTVNAMLQKCSSLEGGSSNKDEVMKTTTSMDANTTEVPSTPSVKSTTTLLDTVKRTRKRSTSKRPVQAESVSVAAGNDTTVGGSKKRKK